MCTYIFLSTSNRTEFFLFFLGEIYLLLFFPQRNETYCNLILVRGITLSSYNNYENKNLLNKWPYSGCSKSLFLNIEICFFFYFIANNTSMLTEELCDFPFWFHFKIEYTSLLASRIPIYSFLSIVNSNVYWMLNTFYSANFYSQYS